MEIQKRSNEREEPLHTDFNLYEQIVERVTKEFSLKDHTKRVLVGLRLHQDGFTIDEIETILGLRESIQRALAESKYPDREMGRKKILAAFDITNAAYTQINENPNDFSVQTVIFPDTVYLETKEKRKEKKKAKKNILLEEKLKEYTRKVDPRRFVRYQRISPPLPQRRDSFQFTTIEPIFPPIPPPVIAPSLTNVVKGGSRN